MLEESQPKTSDLERNSMSPPAAEQTDTSDAENEVAQRPQLHSEKHGDEDRSDLDNHPTSSSSDASSEIGHGSEPHASHSRSSSSHAEEVTRVTLSPDRTADSFDRNSSSLDVPRMAQTENQEILILSSQASQSDDDDSDSVEDLLREIQSTTSTATSQQKDPEGRYNSSRKFSDNDLKNLGERESSESVRSPSEPPPVKTLETTMPPLETSDEKKHDAGTLSPATSLESSSADIHKLEPDVAKPTTSEPADDPVQLQHRSPPTIDRLPSLVGQSDQSVVSHHTMQPVAETQHDFTRLSTASDPIGGMEHLPHFHQHIDARNSLAMPPLPRLLPAHHMGHGMANQLHHGVPAPAQAAPAPGHAANGYHHHQMNHLMSQMHAAPPPSSVMMSNNGGKRKIHLRLIEDISVPTHKRRTSFLSFRRKKVHDTPISENEVHTDADRGRVTVSWYEGTTSLELHEHVRNTVARKLGLTGTTKLGDMRVLDESTDPPEEIVLSTFIPDGSRLLLRFSTRDAGGDVTPMGRRPSYTGGAPDSPSAAPSPYASALDLNGLGLNPNQLALLGARLEAVQMPLADDPQSSKDKFYLKKRKPSSEKSESKQRDHSSSKSSSEKPTIKSREIKGSVDKTDKKDKDDGDDDNSKASSTMEMHSLHPEDQIQKSLRQITELLVAERAAKGKPYVPRQEKRQVVFVLANYFVLFLSLIAISAEIQARAPGWNASVEQYLKNVRSCSRDQDALFECVSNGDLAGLMASVVLWFSRSAATKRIFLFGFESPQKLWTVVYESLVTAICWGFSYIFIRRGMNPDTHRNFLQKYWKDAIYGSLAGFNAAFLKHVLKNLIPQEAIEDALQERQLKILSWLPSFS